MKTAYGFIIFILLSSCQSNRNLDPPVITLPLPQVNYYPKKFSSCDEMNYHISQKANQIGRQWNEYLDLAAVLRAKNDGEIEMSKEVTIICYDEIFNLNCDNPKVKNAYKSQKPNPFEGVAKMIPASCENLYQ